jgi:hypothetical protein
LPGFNFLDEFWLYTAKLMTRKNKKNKILRIASQLLKIKPELASAYL